MNEKSGVSMDKITDFLGTTMRVDLKNQHYIIGILSFYHLTEQMIHLNNWTEYNEDKTIFRQGRYIIVNRTAWFQLLSQEGAE